jgi:predicted flap endonuclease-1-like 5' DNA nuclease
MTAIIDIEGIGPVYAAKLKDAGIITVEKLLEAGAAPKGRKDLAEKTGISGDLILEWVNHADLYRIKGVGQEYADLLEASGVDTVVELSHRKAENLHTAMAEMNAQKKLVRQMPTLAMVTAWIEEAKTLPRVVTY